MTTRGRIPLRWLAGLLAAAAFCGGPARADVTLWYNGDFDLRDSQVNQTVSPTDYAYVYDDFVVPAGQSFVLDRVWSNDQVNVTGITKAFWEIRQGVSAGNGGTVVAGGVIAPATETPTGRTATYPEYTIQVSGLNVVLGPGRYFLAVAPDLSASGGGAGSFLDTTSGKNAVGTPPGNNGNSFAYSPSTSYNYNWVPTSSLGLNGSPPYDFSEGVGGAAVASSVPEPSALTLSGLLAVAGLASARVRRRPAGV